MPFSHISHLVPTLFQVTGQGFLPQRKGDRVAVAAGLGRIQPGLEHGPGRAAHRLWCERIGKIHRVLTCEPVQARCDRQGLPVAPQGVRPLLVGKEKNNILLLFHDILHFSNHSAILQAPYSLTAPAVRPAIMYFCKKMKMIRMGMAAPTAAAITRPQS